MYIVIVAAQSLLCSLYPMPFRGHELDQGVVG